MSRSKKKFPIIGIACHMKGSMKKWKKQCNGRIRQIAIDEELGGKSFVRKVNERWSAPDDGKRWWDDPRALRK